MQPTEVNLPVEAMGTRSTDLLQRLVNNWVNYLVLQTDSPVSSDMLIPSTYVIHWQF